MIKLPQIDIHKGELPMNPVEFTCRACCANILTLEALAGESAPCPTCRADVECLPNPDALPSASPSPFPLSAPVTPVAQSVHTAICSAQHNSTPKVGHCSGVFNTIVCGSLSCLLAILLTNGVIWLYFKSHCHSNRQLPEYWTIGLAAKPAHWTHRELHSYLIKKGLECELVGPGGYHGTLFATKELGASQAQALNHFNSFTEGMFFVKCCSSPSEASKEVESESDCNRTMHNHSIFLIYAQPNTLYHIQQFLHPSR
jgi:hypothetical protein